MSFTAKLLKENNSLLWLVTGKSGICKAWWLVRVDPLKVQIFKKKLDEPQINLGEFGEVLFSDYGAKPTTEDITKIRAEGYDIPDDLD